MELINQTVLWYLKYTHQPKHIQNIFFIWSIPGKVNRTLAWWLECLPMAWVQSQLESYQRLKKWYLMPPGLTLSIIRYGSRVKCSNPGKEVAPHLQLKFKTWARLFAFHIVPLGNLWIQLISFQLWINSRVYWLFNFGMATSLGEGKFWIQTC